MLDSPGSVRRPSERPGRWRCAGVAPILFEPAYSPIEGLAPLRAEPLFVALKPKEIVAGSYKKRFDPQIPYTQTKQ